MIDHFIIKRFCITHDNNLWETQHIYKKKTFFDQFFREKEIY